MNIVLGCNYLKDDGHINIASGIFGVLEEKVRQVKTGNIVPAINNTQCKCRMTPNCNINCRNAVYGIQCGGKISFRNIGKRM